MNKDKFFKELNIDTDEFLLHSGNLREPACNFVSNLPDLFLALVEATIKNYREIELSLYGEWLLPDEVEVKLKRLQAADSVINLIESCLPNKTWAEIKEAYERSGE